MNSSPGHPPETILEKGFLQESFAGQRLRSIPNVPDLSASPNREELPSGRISEDKRTKVGPIPIRIRFDRENNNTYIEKRDVGKTFFGGNIPFGKGLGGLYVERLHFVIWGAGLGDPFRRQ